MVVVKDYRIHLGQVVAFTLEVVMVVRMVPLIMLGQVETCEQTSVVAQPPCLATVDAGWPEAQSSQTFIFQGRILA